MVNGGTISTPMTSQRPVSVNFLHHHLKVGLAGGPPKSTVACLRYGGFGFCASKSGRRVSRNSRTAGRQVEIGFPARCFL